MGRLARDGLWLPLVLREAAGVRSAGASALG
jgi:hypothetical protein